MKGKAIRGRKRLQMLSDVISKSYEELKRGVEDRSWWKKGRHKPDIKADKKLSYCWETVRRESMPRIAEMDVEMTT